MNKQNYLRNWRIKKGYEPSYVDFLLNKPSGWTLNAEVKEIQKLPGSEFMDLARIYNVSLNELFEVIYLNQIVKAGSEAEAEASEVSIEPEL